MLFVKVIVRVVFLVWEREIEFSVLDLVIFREEKHETGEVVVVGIIK